MTLPFKIAFSFGLAAVLCVFSFGNVGPALGKPDIRKLKPQQISVVPWKFVFKKDAPERRTFGKLTWRGGLILTSTSGFFGGFSGLTISPDGKKILSVSDAGFWMSAELGYEGRMLESVGSVRVGPLLETNAKSDLEDFEDAEGIALLGDKFVGGQVLISFERKHRIQAYRIGKTSLSAVKRKIKLPKSVRKLKSNKSLEAVEIIRNGPLKGTVVALPERFKDKRGDLKGWLLRNDKTKPITIKRLGGFDLTGLAALPDGGLLLLERRFRFSEGVKMRIRHLPAKSIRPGARLKGVTLLEAHNIHEEIDNMEGIAAHRAKNGEIVITLISDNNFNFFQRTMLMQFGFRETSTRRASTSAGQ